MTFKELKLKYTKISVKIHQLEKELISLKENKYYQDALYDNADEVISELTNELAEAYVNQMLLKRKLEELI